METDEIKMGDLVQTKDCKIQGYVSAIVDYGTHVCYFIDTGQLLKFPAKREWIEKIPTPDDPELK